LLHGLLERRDTGLSFRIVRGHIHNHANTADLIALLGAYRQRTERRRTSDKFDKLASLHLHPPAPSDRIGLKQRWERVFACPLWVISRHLQCKAACPLSANSGHGPLFDHLVGASVKHRRNANP
jgi:hypothetical protein